MTIRLCNIQCLPLYLILLLAVHGCDDEADTTLVQDMRLDASQAGDGPIADAGNIANLTADLGPPVMDALPSDGEVQAIDLGIARTDSSTADGGQAPTQVSFGNVQEPCETISLVAPSLPAEAGHYVASIITPDRYPFAIETIEYVLVKGDEVATCNGALAHRVLLFALEGNTPLPDTPAATGLGYRQYDVPGEPDAVDGRQVSLSVPIPLILTSGQRAVVAIQFNVVGNDHICVANCLSQSARPGLDWWSNSADTPFNWRDLVADFGFDGQIMVRLFGSVIRE